jgi:histidyl-tRNA synthetase
MSAQKDRKSLNDITAQSFDVTGYVATHFGFTPIETPTLLPVDKKSAGDEEPSELDNVYSTAAERLAIFRTYQEYELSRLSPPTLIHYNLPIKKTDRRKKPLHRYFNLDALGSSKSIVDTLMIQTALSTIKEDGYKEVRIRINTIGDRDAITQYERELANYYRKHIENLPAAERQLFKEDIWNIPRSKSDACKEFLESAPQSLSFLNDTSRLHFKAVLEFVETLGVPYEIDPHLVGFSQGESETLFAIYADDIEIPVVFGCRYGELSRALGFRKIIPAMSVTFNYKPKKTNARTFKCSRLPSPKLHFVQIGPEAKLQSLQIIEKLREAKIPVSHSLAKDKCMGQLSIAERFHIPYILILGQKEALEGTVLLREIESRRQEVVQQSELISRLKEVL